MSDVKVSRRGVYYDLSLSPYEYKSPYGDIFKFRSEKKLEIYRRDVVKEIIRTEKLIDRCSVENFLSRSVIDEFKRAVYCGFYHIIEG